MEDTKTEFEKIFNECIKPVLEVYGIFKDFYGAQNVDIQKINSFETFWKNNKEVCIGELPFKSNTSTDKREELKTIAHAELQNITPEVLQYYDIPFALKRLYTPWIIVHWSKVTVTNEYDKSVEIQDLFSRTKISLNGTINGNPEFLRSTFPQIQWTSDYMHSHIDCINKNNLSDWKSSCLGTGPIRDTIATLSNRCDLNYWQLYCLELEKYVHVESLSGVPYRHLEEIGSSTIVASYKTIRGNSSFSYLAWYREFTRVLNIDSWKDFVKYFITTTEFKFHFIGDYKLALPFPQFAVLASNKFIEWFNAKYKDSPSDTNMLNRLKSARIIYEGIWSENQLKRNTEEQALNIPALENANTCVLRFKKHDVGLKIIPSNPQMSNTVYMLSSEIVGWLYFNIIKIVNYEKRQNVKKPKY